MTKSKLGTGLETTTPIQEIKFTNYAINNHESDFSQSNYFVFHNNKKYKIIYLYNQALLQKIK